MLKNHVTREGAALDAASLEAVQGRSETPRAPRSKALGIFLCAAYASGGTV